MLVQLSQALLVTEVMTMMMTIDFEPMPYHVIKLIFIELNDRFMDTNLDLLTSLTDMYPENEKVLEFKALWLLAGHLNYDLNQLPNELNVIKPMIKNDIIKSTIELYEKLRPYKEPFSTVVSMITRALTIPG